MLTETAVSAARSGAGILMEKFGTDIRIEHKGEVDLVTEADKAAEAAIVATIRERFPTHDIIAEEGDYGVRTSDHCWIIDPLDGTTNYAHGFPWFAVSIGLEVAGEIITGVVYNPCNDELFVAKKGEGATLNGRPILVSSIPDLDQSLLATGFPYDRKTTPDNNYDHFVNFQQAAQACRRPGVASLDLACVAAGRFDGYWEMKLKPWDVAAGMLLVVESGGTLSDFCGNTANIYKPEIVASNGRIHQPMLAVLSQAVRR
ncbi:MAG: inositol monophosphatase [Desulfuromonas sp.]|nr:MAG: inositol monophosphatase [Desulfuromonas sp.]